jgi:hypothetical protein
MIILANGCSHASGAELDESNTDYCYEKAWPKYLADLLKFKNVNLARSGASNDRILRTTYSWVSNYLSARKNPANLFVVILWSGVHRTEIATDFQENNQYFDNGWLPLIIGNDERYKKYFDKETYMFYKLWVMKSCNRYNHTKFYMNVLGMQFFLKSLGIKYLFWNTTVPLIDTPPEMKTFYNLVDKKYYPFATMGKNNYMSIAKRRKWKISEISLRGEFKSHYDEDAQIEFANYLHKLILDHKLLE